MVRPVAKDGERCAYEGADRGQLTRAKGWRHTDLLTVFGAPTSRKQELWVQLEASNDPEQFGAALTQMQQAATLSGGNADLQLSVGVYTQLPGQSGYGVSSQGATLSTGSKLYLQVQSSAHAYLYLYQVNHAGKLTVLFPDPQIKITNPLPAGQSVRIPHGSLTYDVNDKDLGVENLHIVASAQPLGDLASAAQQDQGAERVASNDLDCGTRGLELKAPPTCTKTRGLVLSDQGRSASAGASPSSVRAKAEANDDAVHVVYSFHHVGDHATYGKKNGRGIEMLTGDAAKANRDRDIDSCPGEGEVKHMEVYGGGIERWCVDLNPQGALVDHGPYRKWHPNGKLWVTGQHEWGQRTGTWETFDEQGNATASTSY